MRCKNCGAPLKDGAKFCTKCGAPVEKKSFPRALPVILLALVITFGGGIAAIRTLGSIKAGVSGYDAASGKDKSENKKQRTNKAETEEKAAVKKAAAEKAEKTAETSAGNADACCGNKSGGMADGGTADSAGSHAGQFVFCRTGDQSRSHERDCSTGFRCPDAGRELR